MFEPKHIRMQKIRIIGDGDLVALQLLHGLEHFTLRDEMYAWLIRNKLIGKKFIDFCQESQFKWYFYGNEIKKRIIKEKESRLQTKDLL